MRKIYDNPRILVYVLNPIMHLAAGSVRSDGKSIQIKGIDTDDAANAASRSYIFDDDDDE